MVFHIHRTEKAIGSGLRKRITADCIRRYPFTLLIVQDPIPNKVGCVCESGCMVSLMMLACHGMVRGHEEGPIDINQRRRGSMGMELWNMESYAAACHMRYCT